MPDSHPKITVLLSAYNAESFIQECVDSVLNQTFQNFEFLIFEDCSQDRTLEILRSYRDPRIRLIENKTNQGLTRNLIAGMARARGDFIARVDADDICMPHRFEHQLAYFKDHPDVTVLGSAVTYFASAGDTSTCYEPECHDEIKVALLLGYTMVHPTVMMRKSVMEKHDLTYDASFVYSQDLDLWTRAVRKVRFANIPQVLIQMRTHTKSVSKCHKAEQKEFSKTVRKRLLDELCLEYSEAELEAFHVACGMLSTFSPQQLFSLESVYLKILAANKSSLFYESTILQTRIARSFRIICLMLLCKGDRAGGAYWTSRIRKYDQLTLRQRMALIYRTIKSYSANFGRRGHSTARFIGHGSRGQGNANECEDA